MIIGPCLTKCSIYSITIGTLFILFYHLLSLFVQRINHTHAIVELSLLYTHSLFWYDTIFVCHPTKTLFSSIHFWSFFTGFHSYLTDECTT